MTSDERVQLQAEVIVRSMEVVGSFFRKCAEFFCENVEAVRMLVSCGMVPPRNLESGESEMRVTPFHVSMFAVLVDILTASQLAKKHSKAVREGWNDLDGQTLFVAADGVNAKGAALYRVAFFPTDCETVRRMLCDTLLADVTVCPPKKGKPTPVPMSLPDTMGINPDSDAVHPTEADFLAGKTDEPPKRQTLRGEDGQFHGVIDPRFNEEKEMPADGIEKTPIEVKEGETGELHASPQDESELSADEVNEPTETIELPSVGLSDVLNDGSVLNSEASEARYADAKGDGVQRTYEQTQYDRTKTPFPILYWRVWVDGEILDQWVSELYDIPADSMTSEQPK